MQENFDACLAFTLKYEGGYINNPRDPGGPTNMGVTQATLSHELGRAASIADLRNLSRAAASAIYHKKYWMLVGGDSLPLGVDLMAFDIAVNSGPGTALRLLARTAHLTPAERIAAMDRLRLTTWRSLRTWRFFGRGWTARENACCAIAQHMEARTSKASFAPVRQGKEAA